MWVFGIVLGIFLTGASCMLYLITLFLAWLLRYYSFHWSIQHIIKEMQHFKRHFPLKEFTTLTFHIVSKYPLFDKEPEWEKIMSDFRNPDLVNTKTLNLVFIVESEEPFKPLLKSKKTNLSKDRVVTHTMKQMFYHMYYSSDEYIEPDAVLVYNTSMMLENENDALHSGISFRNIMSNENAILALFDSTKENLKQGVRAVESAQPDLFVWDYRTTPWNRFHFTFIQNCGS